VLQPQQPAFDVPNPVDWCEMCGDHYAAWCPGCAACMCAGGCDPDCTSRTAPVPSTPEA
jgi:hypothetical protein